MIRITIKISIHSRDMYVGRVSGFDVIESYGTSKVEAFINTKVKALEHFTKKMHERKLFFDGISFEREDV